MNPCCLFHQGCALRCCGPTGWRRSDWPWLAGVPAGKTESDASVQKGRSKKSNNEVGPLWAIFILVNSVVCFVAQLSSVECFFPELKCDQVALHFLRSRYTWHLHLAFVEPFVMQDLFLSFRLSPDYTSVLLAVNCLLFYPLWSRVLSSLQDGTKIKLFLCFLVHVSDIRAAAGKVYSWVGFFAGWVSHDKLFKTKKGYESSLKSLGSDISLFRACGCLVLFVPWSLIFPSSKLFFSQTWMVTIILWRLLTVFHTWCSCSFCSLCSFLYWYLHLNVIRFSVSLPLKSCSRLFFPWI